MPICKKCSIHFPNRIKIEGKYRVIQKRVFCLECSPFNKHNTRDLTKQIRFTNDQALCSKCKKWLNIALFYKKTNRDVVTSWCRSCFSKDVSLRKQRRKQQSIQYKGGKCLLCGYNKCSWALDFHHKDGKTKENTLSVLLRHSFEKAKKELDKCNLLCKNCHAETEFQLKFGQTTSIVE